MIWVALLSGAVALGLIFFNVQPVWLQYSVFCVSLSLLLTYLIKGDGLAKTTSNHFISWIKKRGFVLTVFLFLTVGSFLSRRYEIVWDLSQYRV